MSIYGLKKENCPTAEIGSASRVCNQQLPFQCPWLFSLCFGVGKEDLFCLLFGIIYFILFFFFFFPQFPPIPFLFFFNLKAFEEHKSPQPCAIVS